jgi:ATP-dependent helicase/nuclease subunit A
MPKRYKYRFIDGHPGLGEGPGIASRVGILTHLAVENSISDYDTLKLHDPLLEAKYIEEALLLASKSNSSEVYNSLGRETAAHEHPIIYNAGGITFHGVIDLLGSDYVLDLKTDAVVDPLHHKYQLWAYAMATGMKTAHLAYLRHDILHTFNSASLDEISDEARQMIDQMRNGIFDAKPSEKACSYCPFREICSDAKLNEAS